jgi:hypothetical protein
MAKRPPKNPVNQSPSPRFRRREKIAGKTRPATEPIRTLRDLTRQPLEGGNPEFMPELHEGSDRSVAIIMAANVERDLENMLITCLVQRQDK